ncbi:hypothetical protein ACSBR1_039074 [Camellia fascicularis]
MEFSFPFCLGWKLNKQQELVPYLADGDTCGHSLIVDHQGPKLFGLKCRQFVDWINFAFQKRVKRLKFNFRCTWTNGNWNYPLTAHILHYHRLDSLTSLYLCYVDVTRQVLEYILFVCPLLEELSILHSRSLLNFAVSGPSFKLKYLEIEGCFCLKSVDIYDANLVSFKYSRLNTYIAFKNTPHLVKASFDGPYARYIVKNFIQVSSYLLQLETLVLNLSWGLKMSWIMGKKLCK